MSTPNTLSQVGEPSAVLYNRHHFNCIRCIAAGRGSMYGTRCPVGLELWGAYQASRSVDPFDGPGHLVDEIDDRHRCRFCSYLIANAHESSGPCTGFQEAESCDAYLGLCGGAAARSAKQRVAAPQAQATPPDGNHGGYFSGANDHV